MPVRHRRQTLGAIQASTKPAAMPSKQPLPKAPRARQSMIPRMAGSDNAVCPPSVTASTPSPSRRAPTSRKSLGGPPNSHLLASRSPSRNRRVSLAPSTAGGQTASSYHYPSVDPRDNKDKAYLSCAIRKMVAYLKERGYDASVLNVKQLLTQGPSGKDFNNIMTFLLRRLDPAFNCSNAAAAAATASRSDEVVIKFEEEVSMAFRTLGYPFPISKTGIVAVGAPHTWPALIAAIDWLVDVLEIKEVEDKHDWEQQTRVVLSDKDGEEDEEFYTLDGNTARATWQFDTFLRKSMVAFLNNDNEMSDELEAELLEQWNQDDERVDKYLTQLDGECGTMREELERLKKESEMLSEIHRKREEYATDIEKFLALINQLNEHQAELKLKVSTLTSEKCTIETQIKDSSTNIQRLQETIASQELSVDDVRKMERQKVRLVEHIENKKQMLDGHVNVLKELQMKWGACYQLFEQTVKEYNTRAISLELIPENARHAPKDNYKVEIHCDKERASESVLSLLGNVDVSAVVAPFVKELAENYEIDTSSEKKRLIELKERIELSKTSCKEMTEEINMIEENIVLHEERSTTERGNLESEIKGKHRQLELLQTKISTLNDPRGTESIIERYIAQYDQLILVQKSEDEANVSKLKAVSDEIRAAVEAAQKHDDFVRKSIEDMNRFLEKKIASMKLTLLDS